MRFLAKSDLPVVAQIAAALGVDYLMQGLFHAVTGNSATILSNLLSILLSAIIVAAGTNALFRRPSVTVSWRYQAQEPPPQPVLVLQGALPHMLEFSFIYDGSSSALASWVTRRLRQDQCSIGLTILPASAALLTLDAAQSARAARQHLPNAIEIPLDPSLADGLSCWARVEVAAQGAVPPTADLACQFALKVIQRGRFAWLVDIRSEIRHVRFA